MAEIFFCIRKLEVETKTVLERESILGAERVNAFGMTRGTIINIHDSGHFRTKENKAGRVFNCGRRYGTERGIILSNFTKNELLFLIKDIFDKDGNELSSNKCFCQVVSLELNIFQNPVQKIVGGDKAQLRYLVNLEEDNKIGIYEPEIIEGINQPSGSPYRLIIYDMRDITDLQTFLNIVFIDRDPFTVGLIRG